VEEVLIVKYGELALRGGNRGRAEKTLLMAIKNKIAKLGNFNIVKEQGRLVIESEDEIDFNKLIPIVTTTLGIVGVSKAIKLKEQSVENIKKYALIHMQDQLSDDNKTVTFKVKTRRANKNYLVSSVEVSSSIGAYIIENMNGIKVDVKNPDITLNIEIRNEVYIFSKVVKGFGGLPVGTSGKAMLLLSGGIDSPVAGFSIAKRGVLVEAVYFHSSPYVSERAKEKVIELSKRLTVFCEKEFRLHIVPFTEVQLYLKERTQEEKLTVFLKRAMLKIADKIAINNGCQCLITGDSVGQVASQTLHGLMCMQSSTKLPILRPLSGMDKQEIVDFAIKLKTYEISIQPYEDCCTIFVAKHPETKPKASIIESIEIRLLELDGLIDTAVQNTQILSFQE
jgi:tRNA uracil 4-sulfurtransferase